MIHQAPSNQTVLEYSNITLVCNATSNPPSNIVWTQNESSTILHQGNAFIIRNVSRNFNGKRYKCTTENNVTEDAYSYAVVTVICKYSIMIAAVQVSIQIKLVCEFRIKFTQRLAVINASIFLQGITYPSPPAWSRICWGTKLKY